PTSTLSPYTTLFRAETGNNAPSASEMAANAQASGIALLRAPGTIIVGPDNYDKKPTTTPAPENQNSDGDSSKKTPAVTEAPVVRSEEHTSELQSRFD